MNFTRPGNEFSSAPFADDAPPASGGPAGQGMDQLLAMLVQMMQKEPGNTRPGGASGGSTRPGGMGGLMAILSQLGAGGGGGGGFGGLTDLGAGGPPNPNFSGSGSGMSSHQGNPDAIMQAMDPMAGSRPPQLGGGPGRPGGMTLADLSRRPR